MTATLRDFTLWLTAATGALYALVKLVQTAIGYIGNRSKGDLATFESVMKAHVALLADCRTTCDQLRAAEQRKEEAHALALQAKDTMLRREREEREKERDGYYREVAQAHRRVYELEGILRREGWREPRREPRNLADSTDGEPPG